MKVLKKPRIPTDREKIETMMYDLGVPMKVMGKTTKAAGRRYHFNDEGELVKVQEMSFGEWKTVGEE